MAADPFVHVHARLAKNMFLAPLVFDPLSAKRFDRLLDKLDEAERETELNRDEHLVAVGQVREEIEIQLERYQAPEPKSA